MSDYTIAPTVSISLVRLDRAALESPLLLHQVPAEYVGSAEGCIEYARRNGFYWRKSDHVYGGYYVNEDGDCLMPV